MIVYDFPFTIIVTRLLRGRLELATVYPIRMWLSTELLCFWRNKVIIHSMTFLCAVIVFVCWCLRIRMRDLCNVSFRPTFWASRAIAVKWAKEIHQNTICKLMSPQNGKTFCERTDWQYETWNLVCDNTVPPPTQEKYDFPPSTPPPPLSICKNSWRSCIEIFGQKESKKGLHVWDKNCREGPD